MCSDWQKQLRRSNRATWISVAGSLHNAGGAAAAQQLRDRVPRYLPLAGVGNKTGTFRGIRNDAGLLLRGDQDVIAFALFTFDRTPLPVDNSRLLSERNLLVNGAMADVGEILWESLGRNSTG